MNLGFTAIIFSELDVIRSKEHKLILRGIYMGEKKISGIIRTIAERHGTSSTEVRAALDAALSAAEPNAPVQQGEILT